MMPGRVYVDFDVRVCAAGGDAEVLVFDVEPAGWESAREVVALIFEFLEAAGLLRWEPVTLPPPGGGGGLNFPGPDSAILVRPIDWQVAQCCQLYDLHTGFSSAAVAGAPRLVARTGIVGRSSPIILTRPATV